MVPIYERHRQRPHQHHARKLSGRGGTSKSDAPSPALGMTLTRSAHTPPHKEGGRRETQAVHVAAPELKETRGKHNMAQTAKNIQGIQKSQCSWTGEIGKEAKTDGLSNNIIHMIRKQ